MNDIPEGYKRCSNGDQCTHPEGPTLPATRDYFYANARGKYGLHSRCKKCQIAIVKAWSQHNAEHVRERKRNYRCAKATSLSTYTRNYYQNHRDALREKQRNRRRNEVEKTRDIERRSRKKHLIDIRIRNQRRAARKRGLPKTLTTDEWLFAIDYFHGCCAVCGRQANDLFGTHTLAADHWIPLSSPDCPGTVATNIVPLCHGEGGCNNSKNDKEAEKWLIKRYGKRRGKEILRCIEEYFRYIQLI